MQVAVMIKHDFLRGADLMWGTAHIMRQKIDGRLMGLARLAELGRMRSIVSNTVCFCTRNGLGGLRGNIVSWAVKRCADETADEIVDGI